MVALFPSLFQWQMQLSPPVSMSRRMHVVHIINKGTTSHPLIMGYLIQLFWLPVVYNLRLQIVKPQANRM